MEVNLIPLGLGVEVNDNSFLLVLDAFGTPSVEQLKKVHLQPYVANGGDVRIKYTPQHGMSLTKNVKYLSLIKVI
jgi:hypothetical protein